MNQLINDSFKIVIAMLGIILGSLISMNIYIIKKLKNPIIIHYKQHYDGTLDFESKEKIIFTQEK